MAAGLRSVEIQQRGRNSVLSSISMDLTLHSTSLQCFKILCKKGRFVVTYSGHNDVVFIIIHPSNERTPSVIDLYIQVLTLKSF